ncbi:MAG: DNA polymerase III subunit delta' [bacterium]
MSFEEIEGQPGAIKILQKEMATSSLPGAYLFVGPTGVGKMLTALAFAKALNCKEGGLDSCDHCSSCRKIDHMNHPDVRVINPEESSIKIEQIRDLKREVGYRLFEGKKKVWIIEEADKLTVEAANSLLKILEEPPPDVVFILISETPEKLPPTILSRCEIINFFSLSSKALHSIIAAYLPTHSPKANLIKKLARGKAGEALSLIKDENILKNRDAVLDILSKKISLEDIFQWVNKWKDCGITELERTLDVIIFWFRDLLMLKQGISRRVVNYDRLEELKNQKETYSYSSIKQAIETVERTKGYLKCNVSRSLALEAMLLRLRGCQSNAQPQRG